jgi:hypothetical protein
MSIRSFLKRNPLLRNLSVLPALNRGFTMANQWNKSERIEPEASEKPNPLREYFNSVREGRGIWKWDHYFDIYHKHLQKFVGRNSHIAEVGVYSGGSLQMWHFYFGPRCTVYGIDCQQACKAYEDEKTRIFIGDQADRTFWKGFREQVPELDVLIDDGGHRGEQQIATLEEILPHLRPGGVYICEDITAPFNRFANYMSGFSTSLNTFHTVAESVVQPTPLQRSIASIHFYPFVTVIEKCSTEIREFRAPRRGTEWQPFLSR